MRASGGRIRLSIQLLTVPHRPNASRSTRLSRRGEALRNYRALLTNRTAPRICGKFGDGPPGFGSGDFESRNYSPMIV